MEEIYQEYRERLIKSNPSSLELEIFETFIRTDFIGNTLELIKVLENKDYKGILKELKVIEKNIYSIKDDKYTRNERLGYSNIICGYIRRVQSIIHKELDNKYKLLDQAEEILKQKEVDIEVFEKWIKKYKKYIIENYKKNSREYKLLTICNLSIEDKIGDNIEINKMLLRMSVEFGVEILNYYIEG